MSNQQPHSTTCLMIAREVVRALGLDPDVYEQEVRWKDPFGDTAVYKIGPVTAGVSYFIADDVFKVHARYQGHFAAIPLHEGFPKALWQPLEEFSKRYVEVLAASLLFDAEKAR